MTSRYSMDEYGQDTVRANNNNNDMPRPSILSSSASSENSTPLHSETVFQDTVTSILSRVCTFCHGFESVESFSFNMYCLLITNSFTKIAVHNVDKLRLKT
jgi:hypothetical protein